MMYREARCKKHPKYKAIRYPTSGCTICLHIWNQKQGCARIMAEVDRKYMEKLSQDLEDRELFKAICREACSCDLMSGWTCNFCRELKSKLEKALKVSYRPTRSPYWPRKMKGVV